MKRIFILLICLMLTISVSGCGKPNDTVDPDAEVEFLVVLLTDRNGLNDGAINESCWKGLQRASLDFDMNVEYVEPTAGYAEGIKEAAEMQPDLIICPNPDISEVLLAVSDKYVDQLFVVFDEEFPDNFNITTVNFNKEERAFMAGITAALCTNSDVVGFIGYDNDIAKRYLYGYTAGVVSTDTSVYISTNYITEDAGKKGAKKTAVAQCKLGADVIFHIVDQNGKGVIDASEERGFKTISLLQEDALISPEETLCTIVQNGEMAVYDVVKRLVEGSFDGSSISYGLANDGFYINDVSGNLSEEMLEAINERVEDVKSGKIVVPYDNLTYQTFINGGKSPEDLTTGIVNTNPEMDIQ